MKNIISSVTILISSALASQAAIIAIDLSPTAGLALSSTNYTSGDHALGLSALNAVGQPASSATGGEIGAGITFDDVTKVLSWNIGYGSDFGFVDLNGDFSVAHIHGPVAVQFPSTNTGAGVALGLSHTAGSSNHTGSFIGSSVLDASEEADLFNNLLYVNVHSSFAGGGEIRGQLVPVTAVPEPATYALMLGLGALGFIAFKRRRQ